MDTQEMIQKEYNVDFDNGNNTSINILDLLLKQIHEIYLESKENSDLLPLDRIFEFDFNEVDEDIAFIRLSVDEVANIILHILDCGITYEIKTVHILRSTMGSTESEVQMFSTDESTHVSEITYIISFTKSFISKYEEFMKTKPDDIEQLISKYY